MMLWKHVEDLKYKLCQKAYSNYTASDYYVFKHVINNTYRVCIRQQASDFVFGFKNMQEINDFFKNLYIV